eukprot:s94_g61.t1
MIGLNMVFGFAALCALAMAAPEDLGLCDESSMLQSGARKDRPSCGWDVLFKDGEAVTDLGGLGQTGHALRAASACGTKPFGLVEHQVTPSGSCWPMHCPVIQKLPQDVIEKLRGNVMIPSVARAAEEMVLNAVEADASVVEVELHEAAAVGCALEVRDNGRGIDPDDFDQLGIRGARSGRGRGESLAALVALSQRVVLLSKVAGKETWCKSFQSGAMVKCGPAGHPRGDMANLLRLIFCVTVAYGALVEEEMNALLDDSCEGECTLSLLQIKGAGMEEADCTKWAQCPVGAKYYLGQECNSEGMVCASYGSQKRSCLRWVNCKNSCYCAQWAKLLEEGSDVEEKA